MGSRRRRGDTGCPPGRCSAGASGAHPRIRCARWATACAVFARRAQRFSASCSVGVTSSCWSLPGGGGSRDPPSLYPFAPAQQNGKVERSHRIDHGNSGAVKNRGPPGHRGRPSTAMIKHRFPTSKPGSILTRPNRSLPDPAYSAPTERPGTSQIAAMRLHLHVPAPGPVLYRPFRFGRPSGPTRRPRIRRGSTRSIPHCAKRARQRWNSRPICGVSRTDS
jgi:hypothetical protein